MARKKGSKKGKFGELEKFAFKMGQVMRGLGNPNSLISDSYNNGNKKPEKIKKKSLF